MVMGALVNFEKTMTTINVVAMQMMPLMATTMVRQTHASSVSQIVIVAINDIITIMFIIVTISAIIIIMMIIFNINSIIFMMIIIIMVVSIIIIIIISPLLSY